MSSCKRESLHATTSPLTKYFKVVPRSMNKEDIVQVPKTNDGIHRQRATTPLTRNPLRHVRIGSRGSPLDSVTLSSDDEEFCPRKKRLIIKDLFNDNIINKPNFPSVDPSRLPRYLQDTCHPCSTPSSSSSSDSDIELPSIFEMTCSEAKKFKTDPFDESKSMTPDNDLSFQHSKEEYSPQSDSVENGTEDMCMIETMEISDTFGDHLEYMMQTETKLQSLDMIINSRGLLAVNTDEGTNMRSPVVHTFTPWQEDAVDHHLSLCMTHVSLQLSSAVDYVKTITSSRNMPTGNVLWKIWKILLENEIDNDVIEYTVHYFSSLLLIHPPNHGCQLTEYTKFIEQIRNDVIGLLRSDVQWKFVLLEFITGLLLLEYKSSLLQDSLSDKTPPLFLRVFWPRTSLYHVNNIIRLFIVTTIKILEQDILLLMTRRLNICCQLLFLINSSCDISHDLYIELQQSLHLLPVKYDLFLSLLHPFSLTFFVYKSILKY